MNQQKVRKNILIDNPRLRALKNRARSQKRTLSEQLNYELLLIERVDNLPQVTLYYAGGENQKDG